MMSYFSKHKAYLKHLAYGSMKKIGVRMNNSYKLQVETCTTLRRKAGNAQSRDVEDLWHIHTGHLHHVVLKILQQIAIGLPQCTFDQHDVCKGC